MIGVTQFGAPAVMKPLVSTYSLILIFFLPPRFSYKKRLLKYRKFIKHYVRMSFRTENPIKQGMFLVFYQKA